MTCRADPRFGSGIVAFVTAGLAVVWCTFASSSMFVTLLQMRDQRLLVAYPVALFYCCFALMSVF